MIKESEDNTSAKPSKSPNSLPNYHVQGDLESKLDKSDPLRYRQTLEVITTPIKYWIYLSLISSIGVLMWSIFGRIPEKKVSQGIITSPFAIESISEPPSIGGIYKKILVSAGDKIIKGQNIAELENQSLLLTLDDTKNALQNAKQLYKEEYESDLYKTLKEEQEKAVENTKQYLSDAEKYYSQGAISKSIVRSAQSSYQSSLQTQLNTIQTSNSQESNILNLNQKLVSALKSYEQASILKSPYDGTAIMVYKTKGQSNNPSGIFMQIDTSDFGLDTSNNLEMVTYFSSTDAAKIIVGQEVHILPNNIKENTVGNILGEVKSISNLPISKQQAESILGSSSIANQLLGNRDLIQVVINLVQDSNNNTGYKWIHGNGPTKKNLNQYPRIGLIGKASVITARTPPITLGIPAFKKFFGIE